MTEAVALQKSALVGQFVMVVRISTPSTPASKQSLVASDAASQVSSSQQTPRGARSESSG